VGAAFGLCFVAILSLALYMYRAERLPYGWQDVGRSCGFSTEMLTEEQLQNPTFQFTHDLDSGRVEARMDASQWNAFEEILLVTHPMTPRAMLSEIRAGFANGHT